MKYIISLCLILNITAVKAQTHIKNQKFIDLNLHTYDKILPNLNNFGMSLGIGIYNKTLNAQIIKASFATKTTSVVDDKGNISTYKSNIKSVFINYTYEKNVYRNYNNTVLLNVPIGANIGYESINDNNRILKDKYTITTPSDFIVGPSIGILGQYHNFSAGIVSNLNLVSNYTKFSLYPTISYRFHL